MGVDRRRPDRRRLRVSAAAGGVALSADAVFTLRNVEKNFTAGGTRFELLVSRLDIGHGAKVALIGESGSGKSTLLELLAMILKPSACGEFRFRPLARGEATDVEAAWSTRDIDRLTDLRSRHIGYVLQQGGLLPYLRVRENIELSRNLLGLPLEDRAARLAEKLGIAQQLDKLPAALSVGQRQRAAIARALAHDPPILIADEPTAAIDPLNAERIMRLLAELTSELGVTLILATHAHELMRRVGFTLIPHQVEKVDERAMRVRVTNG